MRIVHVVGARPNFMKAAPVIKALNQPLITQFLVHTGQHYDANMSDVFFQQLGLPPPDVNLGVGSGSHAVQTAQVMIAFEKYALAERPHLALVYGDVNSTVAAALVCAKLQIRVGHVEAGLRSFDDGMPEEINRRLTDQISNLLFTPSADGDENLAREGIRPERIHRVGNVMIDTLVNLLPVALERWESGALPHPGRRYALVTLHRPSNVDEPGMLHDILSALVEISRDLPVIFPVHPRTRQHILTLDQSFRAEELHLVEPLGYLDFLALQSHAAVVITDSGGIQEESTFLGVPCLTVRENTERPVTVTLGTNILVGRDMTLLRKKVAEILAGQGKRGGVPPLWDGHAAERIAHVITGGSR